MSKISAVAYGQLKDKAQRQQEDKMRDDKWRNDKERF